MRSHSDIIGDAGGSAKFAGRLSSLGAYPDLCKAWKRTNSIPAQYWKAIVDKGLATFEELAVAVAKEPCEPEDDFVETPLGSCGADSAHGELSAEVVNG